MTTPKTRVCTVCHDEKVLETDFGKQSNGKYGRQSACKSCTKEILAAYRKTPKGKAKHREYAKRYREKAGYTEKHQAYRETPQAKWKAYRKDAERRALPFDFTLDEFVSRFWRKPCTYCGDPIKTVGVDRLDSSKGYTINNTVPCCYTCNLMKLKATKRDFIRKCMQIARHWDGAPEFAVPSLVDHTI